MNLNDRKQEILAAVIRSYILSGEPVGSKNLRDSESLNLSSATIRNEMSDLCEMGFLEQPHTSAGRVPTALGYRFYIERLMQRYQLSQEDKKLIDSLLPEHLPQAEQLMDVACGALAELTRATALVTTPAEHGTSVVKIQLIALGQRTVMLILITSAGMIRNRVVRCDGAVPPELLEMLQNLFAREIYGVPIEQIHTGFLQGLAMQLGVHALTAAPIISAAADLILETGEPELRLSGESNLLLSQSFSAQQASALIEYLRSHGLTELLARQPSREFTVVLGSETGESALSSSGMVVAHYRLGDKTVGALGIVGPDRMDYEHIIPSILYFSESLGRLLTDSLRDEF